MNGRQLDRLGNMPLRGGGALRLRGRPVDHGGSGGPDRGEVRRKLHPDHVGKILHGMNFSSQKAEGWAREHDEKKVRGWVRDTLPDKKAE